jgi:hypothetical protein
MNEAAALPSPRVLLSRRLKQYYGRLRLPPGSRPLPGSSPVIGRDAPALLRRTTGPGRASQVPAVTIANVPRPLRRGVHRGCDSRLFTPSVAFAVKHSARLSLFRPKTVALTARQASLEATDRSLAPPTGLSTLGFDPTRFQTEPPACYRASWQLPGPDSHRQATTSLRWITIYISTSNSWRTADIRIDRSMPRPRLCRTCHISHSRSAC